MRAKQFVELIQIGAEVPEALGRAVKGLYARDPKALARIIAKEQRLEHRTDVAKNVPRQLLADITREFHKRAGTLTPVVREGISNLQSGAPIIRVAHQANLFSYLNIVVQPLMLAWVGRELARQSYPTAEVFIIVDYDASSDKRFSLSSYPDLDSRNGVMSMSVKVPKEDRDVLMCYMAKPTGAQISDWIVRIREIGLRDIAAIGRKRFDQNMRYDFLSTLAEISDHVHDAWSRAQTLSDFNAIFLSRLVNAFWGLRTLFIPGHLVMPHLKPQMDLLISQYPDIVEAVTLATATLEATGIDISTSIGPRPDLAPLWYVCNKCRSRVALTGRDDQELIMGAGRCHKCKEEYRLSLTALQNDFDVFVPRIILDNLLEGIGWGVIGGVGYIGAAEHELVSGLAASFLGWPVPADLMWRTRGIYFGTAECRFAIQAIPSNEPLKVSSRDTIHFISRGAASGLYYLISQGIQGLADMWNLHWENGGTVTDIVSGKCNLNLQESERQALYSLAADF